MHCLIGTLGFDYTPRKSMEVWPFISIEKDLFILCYDTAARYHIQAPSAQCRSVKRTLLLRTLRAGFFYI